MVMRVMTEKDWFGSKLPIEMLLCVLMTDDEQTGKTINLSDRVLRLFCCGCFYVHYKITLDGCPESRWLNWQEGDPDELDEEYENDDAPMRNALSYATDKSYEHVRPKFADVLRCVRGNPFRESPKETDVKKWATPQVKELAEAAYSNSPDGKIDNFRLLLLADALEESGCECRDILNHLRFDSIHVRGCWVLNFILKECKK